MTSDSYFTLTFYARKPKTDRSEYPLYARISVGGQMTEFTVGRSVNPKHWNQKRNLSDGTSRRDKELNKFLEMVRARFCEIHNMLIRENKLVNPAILKAHYPYFGNLNRLYIGPAHLHFHAECTRAVRLFMGQGLSFEVFIRQPAGY